jgi:hypothetical protein
MIRISCAIAAALMPSMLAGQVKLTAPADILLGKNLQTFISIKFSDPAPEQGLDIVVTSNDPGKLLLSEDPYAEGSRSIVLKSGRWSRESSDFWLQGLSSEGSVSYTATAPGTPPVTGVVNLASSGIAIAGPFGGPWFRTTSGSKPSKITISTVVLDPNGKPLERQMVAAGRSFTVNLKSSNEEIGRLAHTTLVLKGPGAVVETDFQPSGVGDTTLSVAAPPGFSLPVGAAEVVAKIMAPGLGVTDGVAIGRNLQVVGVLSLGEPAPPGGLPVRLTSSDPERLLLAENETSVGSGSIEIRIPENGVTANYYLQALAASGEVTYTASAPGFTTRTGTIELRPSGVLLGMAAFGPPDKQEISQPDVPVHEPQFIASVANAPKVMLVAWTAMLDPRTRRGADITVQPLRAGLQLELPLQNTNPAVGSIQPSVKIQGGMEHGTIDFVALSKGTTVISAVIPEGFTPPSNARMVTAVVQP